MTNAILSILGSVVGTSALYTALMYRHNLNNEQRKKDQ